MVYPVEYVAVMAIGSHRTGIRARPLFGSSKRVKDLLLILIQMLACARLPKDFFHTAHVFNLPSVEA